VYLVLVVASAQFYQNPPEGWRPPGWVPSGAVAKAATTVDFTVSEAMRTWQFWLLWFMLFLNVSAGIMVISQASPLAQQLANISPLAAAGMVGLISIFQWRGTSVLGMGVGPYWTRKRVLPAVCDPGGHLLHAHANPFAEGVHHRICDHRTVLQRWLRHYAFFHGGLLRCQIYGRHLRMDSASVGRGCDSVADPDCARSTEYGKLCASDSRHCHSNVVFAALADIGAV
jgi:hypothetical protein